MTAPVAGSDKTAMDQVEDLDGIFGEVQTDEGPDSAASTNPRDSPPDHIRSRAT